MSISKRILDDMADPLELPEYGEPVPDTSENVLGLPTIDAPREEWIFTFGFSHQHPDTGESLANCYVVIEGDVESSRETMIQHFGQKWAMQYPTLEDAGAERYGLRRIEL
jgi:hypothetical protein